MAVKFSNVKAGDPIGTERFMATLVTAISQAGVVSHSYTPGYDYQLTRVRSYCLLKAGTVTFVIKVGARTAVATGVFTSATEVGATLSTTLANVQGSSTEAITITYTTDGSGVLTNGSLLLEFRPRHMAGEV